jgi:putative endonuclease
MTDKQSYVYILASKKHGTLYIGVTSDIIKRVYEHKNNLAKGFTKQHAVHRLVYFEVYEDIKDAIHRETCLKRWKRDWKVRLIEEHNPDWHDLYDSLLT